MAHSALLDVRDLAVRFNVEGGIVHAVNNISYSLHAGESLAIVGESGSGKSVGALALLGLVPSPPGWIDSGEIWFKGRNLRSLSEDELRQVRGDDIALVFQDPMTSLNPVLTIGVQITEAIAEHQQLKHKAATDKAIEYLDLVGIPDARHRLNDYPHQFSGGQRQRIMIAQALCCEPALLIADEPTTALDVTVQAQITELIANLQQQLGMAIIWITHDLGVVAGFVDRVAVMYAGKIIESASVDALYADPAHPYTVGLLRSIPSIATAHQRLVPIPGVPPDLLRQAKACAFAPRCTHAKAQCHEAEPPLTEVTKSHETACWHSQEVRAQATFVTTARVSNDVRGTREAPILLKIEALKTHFPIRRGVIRRTVGYVKAVDGVSFSIHKGETLGLVGESGCGKSTTGQSILRLIPHTRGRVTMDGQDLATLDRESLRRARRAMQMIFQDPYASLNPRMTAGNIVLEGLRIHAIGNAQEQRDRLFELFSLVGLDESFINRYPHEFSGGQRQRIGIARALSTGPSFIVADEPISALDVSIQAQIVNLLVDLRRELDLTYLFIAHDLSMVRYISDRVAVMYLGQIVETGATNAVFDNPAHPYTAALLSAIPVPDPALDSTRRRIILQGDVPDPANPPSGCRFHPRCQHRQPICERHEPEYKALANGRYAACHFAESFS